MTLIEDLAIWVAFSDKKRLTQSQRRVLDVAFELIYYEADKARRRIDGSSD